VIEGNHFDNASSSIGVSVNDATGVWIAGNSFEDGGTNILTTSSCADVLIGANSYAGTNSLAGGVTELPQTFSGDLDDLTDVTITAPATDDVLTYDGAVWVNSPVTATATGGEILISDSPSTPLVFADLVQNEAQDDLVYGDP
jgi:hypothetical protein